MAHLERKPHLKTANMNQEPLTTDLLAMKRISKTKDMVLLKKPLKVTKMTSRSMLLKVNPG